MKAPFIDLRWTKGPFIQINKELRAAGTSAGTNADSRAFAPGLLTADQLAPLREPTGYVTTRP